ncbi:MAG: hypothetical protein JNJ61_17605 [Anaerolineae bacterium]|nr:hypothetical protein [Anaerolineae bacterium]
MSPVESVEALRVTGADHFFMPVLLLKCCVFPLEQGQACARERHSLSGFCISLLVEADCEIVFYNRQRLHSSLGCHSPPAFEIAD